MRVLLGISFACACGSAPATFPCVTSAQCSDGARQGVCELSGWCSFPDPSCASGSRFDPSAGGGLAGMCLDGGTSSDAPATSCLDRWMTGTIRFSAPVDIGINTTESDRDPFETYDELDLYFSSKRMPSVSDDIWHATRASKTASYGAPVREIALSSYAGDGKLSITSDGLYLTLSTSRPGGQGGNSDVWEATRTVAAGAFSALEQTDLAQVNTPTDEFDARVSADGKHLYLAPHVGSTQNLEVAARANVTLPFDPPIMIAELSTGAEADPSPSVDERILVFTSRRTAAFGADNLWYAVRPTATATFGAPQLVPDLNTNDEDGDPHLSPDGCTLYFARATIGSPNYDIFVAKAQ